MTMQHNWPSDSAKLQNARATGRQSALDALREMQDNECGWSLTAGHVNHSFTNAYRFLMLA